MFKDSMDCRCGKDRLTNMSILEYDVSMKERAEKSNAQILSLYRQMKLQKALEECEDLEHGFRESNLYTNKRVLGEITAAIDQNGVDYPRTFQQLTNDTNTNTILTAIQLRTQHLNTDPLGKQQ